jgi:RNA polymerase sigma-70 factor (ECF subfamily)
MADAAHSMVPQVGDGSGVAEGPALDPAVLIAAAAGDDRAWETLVGVYGRRVYALVRSRLRQPEVAEEITQSVFATVAAKLTTGEYAESGRFEPWLFRIAVNRVRDEIRRQRRHSETVDSEMLADVAAAPVEKGEVGGGGGGPSEAMEGLRSAMAELPEADRHIVELRHHAGLSFAQMAELLAEPLGTLLARHHRALKKLKVLLGERGIGGVDGRSELGRSDGDDASAASGRTKSTRGLT